MSSLNYLELCRLCLVKDRVHIGIFEGEGEVRQIFLKIAACLPVKVRKDDRLPKQICDDCLQKVELLYQFWNQTANAEKQLLEWLGETVDDKTVETNVKHEHMEQDAGSELANSLSRVEAVLAEAREHESSDNDHFGDDSHKPETDSDDEPLSSLEPTQFINVNLNGSQSTTAQTQEEFLAPSAPSTSKSNVPAAVAQAAGSGVKNQKAKPFACNMCSKSYRYHHQLRLHALEHNGQQRFTCDLCEYKTNFMSSLKSHKATHSRGQPTFPCKYCDKKFQLKQGAQRHELDIHGVGEKGEYICQECGDVFKIHKHFIYHKRKHTEEKTPCGICGKIYANKQSLRLHLLDHEGLRKYSCDFCDYTSNYKHPLMEHISKVHEKCEQIYPCEHCDKQFVNKQNKQNHVMNVHGINKPEYRCKICGDVFENIYKYKYHKQSKHLPELKEKIDCALCDKTFATIGSLNTHHKRVHLKILRSTCHICGKEVDVSTLKTHLKFHEGIKNNVCEYCGKSFLRKSLLNIHRYIHTGEKPHICLFCGKGFRQLTPLKKHKKRYHSEGQDCILCSVCETAFKTKEMFLMHWKKHSELV